MQPLVIIEFLEALNLGEQIVIGFTLLMIVMSLFRARSWSGRLTATFGTMWLLAVGALAAASFGIIMGWFDPNPVAFSQDVITFGREAVEWAFDLLPI